MFSNGVKVVIADNFSIFFVTPKILDILGV